MHQERFDQIAPPPSYSSSSCNVGPFRSRFNQELAMGVGQNAGDQAWENSYNYNYYIPNNNNT